MRFSWFLVAVGAGSLLLGCESYPSGGKAEPVCADETSPACIEATPGCTVEACDVMMSTCRRAPMGFSVYCAMSPGITEEIVKEDCVSACRIGGMSERFLCARENAALCEQDAACGDDSACKDAARDEFDRRCWSGSSSRDPACIDRCFSAQAQCERDCPTETYSACSSCALDCLREYQSCRDDCPAA